MKLMPKFKDGVLLPPPKDGGIYFITKLKKSHTVHCLDIHLSGQFQNAIIEQIQEDLADNRQKGLTLKAYFTYNKVLRQHQQYNQQEVVLHYYWQMPKYFTWLGKMNA